MSVIGRARAVSSPGVARKYVLISAIALCAVALTGASCSGSAPAASGANRSGGAMTVSARANRSPAVTAAQARQVFDGYVTRTDRALAAGNASAALSLVQAVSWHELSTAITTAKFLRRPLAPYRYGTPAFYIPASSGYPLWFVASVRRTAPPGSPASLAGVSQPATGQALMVFEKQSARQPWRLSGSVELQPGQRVPKLATTAGGDATVAPLDSDGSFLARPDVTGPLQAAVVDDGPAAPASAAVASGPFTTGLYQRQAAIKPGHGEVRQWYMQGSKYDRFALRTASGGALVFYAMYLNTTIEVPAATHSGTAKSGRPIAVPPEFVPLLAPREKAPRERLKTEYVLTFAAIDPPASAPSAKINVIGMGGAPNWLSAS